jgi:hypothetical protein
MTSHQRLREAEMKYDEAYSKYNLSWNYLVHCSEPYFSHCKIDLGLARYEWNVALENLMSVRDVVCEKLRKGNQQHVADFFDEQEEADRLDRQQADDGYRSGMETAGF